MRRSWSTASTAALHTPAVPSRVPLYVGPARGRYGSSLRCRSLCEVDMKLLNANSWLRKRSMTSQTHKPITAPNNFRGFYCGYCLVRRRKRHVIRPTIVKCESFGIFLYALSLPCFSGRRWGVLRNYVWQSKT